MKSVKELREYLQNGYSTIAENIIFEDNKLYQVICVEYDGIIRHYTDTELELGVKNIENGGKEFNMLFEATVKKKEKRLQGLKTGGYDTTEAENEIIELKKIIKGNLK
jgi:tRNA A22 N-methylase